jgi:hypothetical protein
MSKADRRGQDLNPGPLEYEAGILTTQLRRSVVEKYNYLMY